MPSSRSCTFEEGSRPAAKKRTRTLCCRPMQAIVEFRRAEILLNYERCAGQRLTAILENHVKARALWECCRDVRKTLLLDPLDRVVNMLRGRLVVQCCDG
jgi:hypothetical protein